MSEIKFIKLSELTQKIEYVIKETFGSDFYWIVAEVSGHKFYESKNAHYFELIEKAEGTTNPIAKIRGISWPEGSKCIKLFENETGQKFTDGLQVLIKVKVEYKSSFGISLVLYDIDQSFTLGNLEKQRRDTLLRLVAENPTFIKEVGEEYLTANKNIKFNLVIQNIALIGSSNSEGYTDFVHTINSNQFGYKFTIDTYQASVQGAGAEKGIVDKLIEIFKTGKKYDCVVIIRGGGAKTDFLIFDTYDLSRTVAKFPIPIITGIGHHKDVSIVDLMANTSTKTPTKVAEFIISHNRASEDSILVMQKSLIIKSQQLLNKNRQNINNTNQVVINKTKTILYNRKTNLVSLLNQITSKPKSMIYNKNSDLNNISRNIKSFSAKYISAQSKNLEHSESIVKLMSPENILKKGFAIISQDGKILNSAEAIKNGSDLTITMEAHDIKTTVISKQKR